MSATPETLQQALTVFTETVAYAEMGYDRWHASAFDLEFLTDEVNDALYGADYLGALEALEVIDWFVTQVRTALVIASRSTGGSWDEIGDAMGRDRQWAWRTYHQQADFSEELNNRAVDEVRAAIPDFQGWGFDIESMEPEMRKAVSRVEVEAKRRYERVLRAVTLTADAQRRAIVESEKEAERAKKPGRRPGPQPKDAGTGGDVS